MSEKPKRKFWQFHLLTAVLMTFVMAGILWIGVSSVREHTGAAVGGASHEIRMIILSRGFPWTAHLEKGWARGERSIASDEFEYERPESWQGQWCYAGLIGDIAVALSVVALVAVLSEWLIRRREARKA